MAKTAIIDLEVRDNAFARLQEQFDTFNEAVKAQPNSWKNIGKEVEKLNKELGSAMKAMKGTIGTKDAEKNTKSWLQAISGSAKSFGKLKDDSAKLLDNVHKTTNFLMKWTGLGTLFTGLISAGSLFGLDRLGATVAGNSRAARGIGVSYGEKKAFEINYGRYVDPDSYLGNISNLKNDPNNNWVFRSLGINNFKDLNTQQLAMETLSRAREAYSKSDKSPQWMQSMGLDQIFSQDDLRRLQSYSGSDLENSRNATNKDTKDFNQDDKTQTSWQNFITMLDRAGERIESVLVKGLTPLTGPLTELADEFSKAVSALLGSDLVRDAIKKLSTEMQSLADYFGSPKFKSDVEYFEAEAIKLGKALHSAFNWITSLFNDDGSFNWGKITSGGTNLDAPPQPGEKGYGSGEGADRQAYRDFYRRAHPDAAGGAPGTSTEVPDDATPGSDAFPHGNNPWNVKRRGHSDQFATFETPEAGTVNDLNLWRKYQQDDHIASIKDLILKATPRSDNPNVDSYIADVAKMMGKDPTDNINLNDENEAVKWLQAIAKNEGHKLNSYDDETKLRRGYHQWRGDTAPGLFGGIPAWVRKKLFGDGSGSQEGMALDAAQEHLGQGPNEVNSFLKDNGEKIDAAKDAWCAAFVNSALNAVGVKGSGSDIATSFKDWGKAVGLDEIQKGDVLLEARGHKAGETGGHVGLATGNTRIKDGKRQIEMLSGNYGDKVARSWEDENALDIRRSVQDQLKQDSDKSLTPDHLKSASPATPGQSSPNLSPQRNVAAKVIISDATGGNAHITTSLIAAG